MIYLDHASATPVSDKVMNAMAPYFSEKFFNPSSPYLPAKEVREIYEEAKSRIAHTIGAKGTDLIITSGATESTNLAFSVLGNYKALVLETEHASVLNTAKKYGAELIKVTKTGVIDLADLRQKITDDTALISVALVNNELGTIQPLAEISEIIAEVRKTRLENGVKTPLHLHSDASQALTLLNVNVARLKVDLMTLSAAKIYGPKGVGALYVARGIKLNPITEGGGQERGLRSGTENVPGVIGFAKAAEEAKKHLSSNHKHYEKLRELFLSELEHDFMLLGSKKQLASFIPLSFPGLDAERLIYKLEDEEIYLSTGAACAANKGKKSHVLKALGLDNETIAGSLRISLGALNTEENVRLAAKKIAKAAAEEYELIDKILKK